MPHFTLTLSAAGPVVDALILVSAARATVLTKAGLALPQPQVIRALVDTGASHTCLDPSVTAALGLTPTGTTDVVTASTGTIPVSADTYDVGIFIPCGKAGESPLGFGTWKVSSMELFEAQGFHALIGRDILQRCTLHYNGATNFFTIAY